MPLRRLLLPAVLAALLAAAPARADTTTIYAAGDRAPVTIPGTDLRRGDTLAGGDRLVRRLTEVRAGTTRVVTLRCPGATRARGLGVFETADKVGFAAVNRAYVGRANVRVRAFATPGTDRGTLVRASIFLLCR